MRRWLSTVWFLTMTLGFVAPSAGADLTAVEARQIRSVIEAQLKALSADDAPAAFALAAPNIREMFGTADRFIAMVRSGYPVVYRPTSVAFFKPERRADGVVQAVHLTDADNTLWLAVYHLERQADKTWRISGCEVVPAQGRVAQGVEHPRGTLRNA